MNKPSQSARLPLVIAAIIVMVPLLYVLSVGPAAWLCNNGALSKHTEHVLGEIVYMPLFAVCEWFPVCGKLVESYMLWWAG
jgi:hypothetical protein